MTHTHLHASLILARTTKASPPSGRVAGRRSRLRSEVRARAGRAAWLALPLLASIGCGTEPLHPSGLERRAAFDTPPVGVRSGHLDGRLGPASLDAPADPLRAYSSMGTLRVQGVDIEEEHAAMLQVTLRTDEVELVPGVRETFGADDGGRLVLLGCVGQDVDVYDELDRNADEVQLSVDEAGDGRAGDVLVTLSGVWSAAEPASENRASFSFVLVR